MVPNFPLVPFLPGNPTPQKGGPGNDSEEIRNQLRNLQDVVSASISNETNCSCVAIERKLSQAMNMIDSLKIDLTGDTASLPGRTCRDIVQKRPRAPNGVYWISQGENSAPYRVFCDMTTDGGGWTLVTVIKANNGIDERKYPINGMNEENLLADRVDDWASLSRVKLNAIHNWHDDSILRVYVYESISQYPTTYYLQKTNYNDSFDIFYAIRYVPTWGVRSNVDYRINLYRHGLLHTYNSSAHSFTDTTIDKVMKHFEDHFVTVDGVQYTVSRHGIVGDAFESACEWLFGFRSEVATSTGINCHFDDAEAFAKLWIK
ncbi:uncharacterized protein [Oscarella lobularis]|uniref:uncharacterized protein isoform X2 n=1 Tax=Oscarella lobularis TaxID=121494 RepID=UPI00331376EC